MSVTSRVSTGRQYVIVTVTNGPTASDGCAWVNPAHVMYVLGYADSHSSAHALIKLTNGEHLLVTEEADDIVHELTSAED